MNINSGILVACLIMPLNSASYAMVTNTEKDMIPQEYHIGFPQPVPQNQPRNMVAAALPSRGQQEESDAQTNEARRTLFMCGLVYASTLAVVLIVIINHLTT